MQSAGLILRYRPLSFDFVLLAIAADNKLCITAVVCDLGESSGAFIAAFLRRVEVKTPENVPAYDTRRCCAASCTMAEE